MSIQSDIEMLSIEALEYYAKKHQLSEVISPLSSRQVKNPK